MASVHCALCGRAIAAEVLTIYGPTCLTCAANPWPNRPVATECAHDWRVNPFVTLTSNPPMSVVVCRKCRKQRTVSPRPRTGQVTDDSATWPVWED